MDNKKLYKRSLPILLLPVGFVLSYVLSSTPGLVERVYSTGIFKVLGQALSTITGIFPFSLAEFIILFLIAFVLWKLTVLIIKVKGQKSGKRRSILNFIIGLFAAAGIIYMGFIILWGLNYHRQPFSVIAGLDTRPASIEELEDLCESIIERANELRTMVREDKGGVMDISGGSADVFNRASLGYIKASSIYPELGGRYGRPKGVILSRAMSYAGISGVYFPFTSEANVNIEQPDFMLPCTTNHEMAHQRGFAREDEANYIAYLTSTLHPDTDFQYSGIMLALIHSMNALYSHNPEKYMEFQSKYSEGVKRDLLYNNEFWKQFEGPVEDISNEINNAYLKSNLQEDGVYSYGRMVDLLIAEHRLKSSI